MDRTRYTLLLYLLSPFIGLYFIYRGLRDKRYLLGLSERLGFVNITKLNSSAGKECIHIHCASVGETIAATPLIKRLAEQLTDHSLIISTTTPTGKDEVVKLIETIALDSPDREQTLQHCYLPIDWPGACKRFIKRINPSLCVLMETELWPNFLAQLSKRGIPVMLANARLSDRSLAKYQKRPLISADLFKQINLIAAQYSSDADNFKALGVSDEKIKLVGNIKFDLLISNETIAKQQSLKQQWSANRPCWIAASIHPDEFATVLAVHKDLLKEIPNLLLIAVPRHPEKFDLFKQACDKSKLNFTSRTNAKDVGQQHAVVVGDTMGELLLFYGVADIAFVGGSLIERGGHNPLEAAACGLPVIMGHSRYNFSEVTQIMQQAGALDIVADQRQLASAIKAYLLDSNKLTEGSRISAQLLKDNQGAVDKMFGMIEKLLS